jgi:hypothetical protein
MLPLFLQRCCLWLEARERRRRRGRGAGEGDSGMAKSRARAGNEGESHSSHSAPARLSPSVARLENRPRTGCFSWTRGLALLGPGCRRGWDFAGFADVCGSGLNATPTHCKSPNTRKTLFSFKVFFSKLLTFHHIKPFIHTELFYHIIPISTKFLNLGVNYTQPNSCWSSNVKSCTFDQIGNCIPAVLLQSASCVSPMFMII